LQMAHLASELMPYSYDQAEFGISDVGNLQDLPFVPRFDAATMFAGQRIYVSSHATRLQNWPVYFPASAFTVITQTIDATVSAISTDGNFTTYDVAMAPYELIPTLAVQAGQTTVLTDPSNMVVYVDSHTRRRNTGSLAVGSIARFHGLVFNDNGIVRMDCVEVDGGVDIAPVQGQGRAGFVGRTDSAITSYDSVSGNVLVIHQRVGKRR